MYIVEHDDEGNFVHQRHSFPTMGNRDAFLNNWPERVGDPWSPGIFYTERGSIAVYMKEVTLYPPAPQEDTVDYLMGIFGFGYEDDPLDAWDIEMEKEAFDVEEMGIEEALRLQGVGRRDQGAAAMPVSTYGCAGDGEIRMIEKEA